MEKAIKEIAQYASRKGVKSFMLGIHTGEIISFHFENMNFPHLVQLTIAGFKRVIEMYLENPAFSKEYRQVYLDLLRDFDALVKKTDARVIAFNSKSKAKK